MKIKEIKALGLRSATPEGGWSEELESDDCVHTLIAVITDEGIVGFGSVFTNDSLVKSSLAMLKPLYQDENALEPERVSEKASPKYVLARQRRIDHPHDQRDRYCLVGYFGESNQSARWSPARWTLS